MGGPPPGELLGELHRELEAFGLRPSSLTHPGTGTRVASLLPKRTSYFAYRAGAELARWVPEPFGVPATRAASSVAPAVFAQRRRQVERNLRRIHGPGFGGIELQRAVTATFDSYGRYFYELFLLPTRSRSWIDANFACTGIEQLHDAIAAGHGAVLALPHLGNWDFAGAWLAGQGFRVTVVAEPVEPPELFEWFVSTRAQLGMRVIPLSATAGTEVLRALRDNEVVCLLCDRDLTGEGIPVEFFGERTSMPAGPAMAALRAGAPIHPVAGYLRPHGRQAAWIESAVPTERRGPLRDDMARITQDLAHRFEAMIRAEPTHWHLLQPNWPSDRAAAGD